MTAIGTVMVSAPAVTVMVVVVTPMLVDAGIAKLSGSAAKPRAMRCGGRSAGGYLLSGRGARVGVSGNRWET